MTKEKLNKTNVMRILDAEKINYKGYSYKTDGTLTGLDVANILNEDPAKVFKTLVTVGHSGEHYVFVIPVAEELNLKKAASAVGEKNVEMVKQRDLFNLTGYVHGGCSPIGMKKNFKTTFHETAKNFETIIFSAGKIGFQVEVSLNDLKQVIHFNLYDLIK